MPGSTAHALLARLTSSQRLVYDRLGPVNTNTGSNPVGADVERLRHDLGARLDDWRGLFRRQPVQAQQILPKLVAGRLVFTPKGDDEGRS